ncbi:uncharacterized protein B0H64DRAFT_191260 [Chaetomium fimeti]|uniref:Uncharacterized protein n=1 Tax=Chaetomium fimeti TaxID=1854472 RepID=A0AAE0LRA9_9PEZI|nr:hypothetical protein B0H64DRAFT_191260 [Chaetomium fimeti]
MPSLPKKEIPPALGQPRSSDHGSFPGRSGTARNFSVALDAQIDLQLSSTARSMMVRGGGSGVRGEVREMVSPNPSCLPLNIELAHLTVFKPSNSSHTAHSCSLPSDIACLTLNEASACEGSHRHYICIFLEAFLRRILHRFYFSRFSSLPLLPDIQKDRRIDIIPIGLPSRDRSSCRSFQDRQPGSGRETLGISASVRPPTSH